MDAFSRTERAKWSRSAFSATLLLIALPLLSAAGCHSTSYARRTALSAPDLPASDPAVGASFEAIDARNRADIGAHLGRPVAPGPATPAEVIAMTHAGVEPRFIICYINRSTNMTPIGAQDVIDMHQQGVSEQVIQAMLTPGAADSRSEVARSMPPRVLIFTSPYWPYYYPRYGYACGYGYNCY